MVTATLNGTGRQIITFYGLSTDEKPTGEWKLAEVENGSQFYEMDTTDAYLFDEENYLWRKQ